MAILMDCLEWQIIYLGWLLDKDRWSTWVASHYANGYQAWLPYEDRYPASWPNSKPHYLPGWLAFIYSWFTWVASYYATSLQELAPLHRPMLANVGGPTQNHMMCLAGWGPWMTDNLPGWFPSGIHVDDLCVRWLHHNPDHDTQQMIYLGGSPLGYM